MIFWKVGYDSVGPGIFIIEWNPYFWLGKDSATLWDFIDFATPFQRFIGQLGIGTTLFFVLDVGRHKLRLQLPEKKTGLLILAGYLLSMGFLLAGRQTILGWKLGFYLDKALPFDAAAFSTYYLLGKLFRDV